MHRFAVATFWGVGLTTLVVLALGWRYSRRTARRVRSFAAPATPSCTATSHGASSVSDAQDEFDALGYHGKSTCWTVWNTRPTRCAPLSAASRTTCAHRCTACACDWRNPRWIADEADAPRTDCAGPGGTGSRAAHTGHTAGNRACGDRRRFGQDRNRWTWCTWRVRCSSSMHPACRNAASMPGWRSAARRWCRGNGSCWRSCIANLLENALKYVPAGCTVRVERAPRSDRRGAHCCGYTDLGFRRRIAIGRCSLSSGCMMRIRIGGQWPGPEPRRCDRATAWSEAKPLKTTIPAFAFSAGFLPKAPSSGDTARG